MKISCIGGGAWGTTLAQVLSDNHHEVLIRDINPVFVEKINMTHTHPFFDTTIPSDIHATLSLEEAIEFADVLILGVPTVVMRSVLKEINPFLHSKKLFINVSKGIEPETSYCVSQIVEEEISSQYLKGYVNLSGPSHAEELILRKLTSLVAASRNPLDAIFVQNLFSNDRYLRVYTSSDVIGVETAGAIKNAIAIVSGVASGMGLGENARAFLISRGVREIVMIVTSLGGKAETAYGLAGIGDLIVTASSKNSRNFQCGYKIGQGMSVEAAILSIKQTVEGIKTIKAAYQIGKKFNLELPIIQVAYEVVCGNKSSKDALSELLGRSLKEERIIVN
ncbi:MAG: NAD(P)-dependent glycerol-3-phosphate dehydrogenase [Anaeroplasmataceae bacterium]|nr:NAD(P)-dependent glycerol-3-phosphate dehydrogenase [Anaeroplasmataceae bacterium]